MTFAMVKPGFFRLLVIGSTVLLLVSCDRVTDHPGLPGLRPPSAMTPENTEATQNIDSLHASEVNGNHSTPSLPGQDIDGTQPSPQFQDVDQVQPSPQFQDVDQAQPSPQYQDVDQAQPSPQFQDVDQAQPSPQFQDVDRSSLGKDVNLDVMERREGRGEDREQEDKERPWGPGYQREEEEEEEERRQREQRKRREKEEEEEEQRERFSLRQPELLAEEVRDPGAEVTDQGLEVMDSSRESSGFFLEDGEDKRLLPLRLWEEPIEADAPRHDPDALMEYRHPVLQTPIPSLQEARQPSLSSLTIGLDSGSEAGERELWEGEEGQASGLPIEPHPADDHFTTSSPEPSAPTTSAAVAGDLGSTTSEPDPLSGLAKIHGWDDEREEDTMLTQNPTVPEVGSPPSREPLQPGPAHTHGGVGMEAGLGEDGEESEEVGRHKSEHHSPLTTDPSASIAPTVGFTQLSWDRLGEATPPEVGGSEVRGGATEMLSEVAFLGTEDNQDNQQVVCVDWSSLAGRGLVIINTTENLDCDEFREESGPRLLQLVETAFSRRMNSPQGSWLLSLSKTPRQEHQLLLNLASQHDVIGTKDVLSMLGEIRKGLHEVGIQNYSAANMCHFRPSQTRSDYGKLFVVLVIIGSVCMVIISSGLIYICWQRRLPKTKTMSRGEELHFVENGCHDNPTLDVTSDNQPEMQEKKPSTNGLTGGVAGARDEGRRWPVLVNHPGRQEEEDDMEEDTHL